MAEILDYVSDENRDIFKEIFLTEDSDDEFLGFDIEDLDLDDSEPDLSTELGDLSVSWSEGNLQPKVPKFTEAKKVTDEVGPDPGISDFGKLFLCDELFEIIARETNRYAGDFFLSEQGQALKPQSRFRQFTETTPAEIKRFIAVILVMGLVQQQDLQDYWSTDEILETPFFRKVMTRNRFLLILSLLHLNDNSQTKARGDPDFDPLFKVRPVYDLILAKCQNSYYPGENLALDEGIIAWRGNLAFRVYMPDKPDKFGVKIFMVCDSSNGYCCRFEIYCGDTGVIPSQHGKTYDLVMRLLEPYLMHGHKLFVDNYYTSPILFHELLRKSTGACGTLRSNRKGVPDTIKVAKLKKGEHLAVTNGSLQLLKWKDKRDVLLCSSIHDGRFVESAKTDRVTGEKILRPHCVLEYNKYMGAVDRCDQMITYQAFKRRTLKWWKKVFLHLIMLATLNAYLLYKEDCKRRGKSYVLQRTFRRELAKSLISETNVLFNKPRAVNVVRDSERLTGRHFLSKVDAKQGAKTQTAVRMCVVCSESTGKRKVAGDSRVTHRSRYQCKDCNVGLCVDPCFRLYHDNQDYKLAFKRWKAKNQSED